MGLPNGLARAGLCEAYDRWQDAVNDYVNDPRCELGNAIDEALEYRAALAFMYGYEPNGILGLTEWVVREIAG